MQNAFVIKWYIPTDTNVLLCPATALSSASSKPASWPAVYAAV